MAQDDAELVEVEGIEDTAKPLTTGIVLTTFAVMLIAFIVMEIALGKWFNLGPLKG
jgi:hypothetical protein